jgi:hypothetical protein
VMYPSPGMGSPMSSGPSTPSAHGFSGQNTILWPLADKTNTPIQTPPQVREKRKWTSALSGNRHAKRIVNSIESSCFCLGSTVLRCWAECAFQTPENTSNM